MIHLMLMQQIEGFDWDFGNAEKIINIHNVLPSEAEQMFFNEPLLLMDDVKHSQKETDTTPLVLLTTYGYYM